jgi:uncharacterized membrane protein YedE/YeeE
MRLLSMRLMRPSTVVGIFLVALFLAGCASGPVPEARSSARADCERSGGVWFSGPAACVIGGGDGGGM